MASLRLAPAVAAHYLGVDANAVDISEDELRTVPVNRARSLSYPDRTCSPIAHVEDVH